MKEGRRPDVRLRVSVSVYVSAQDAVQSVTQLPLVESSVGFSVRGAVRCQVSGRSLPPSPKGVTLTAARTALYFLLLVRSC